jgi:hypothetical protein
VCDSCKDKVKLQNKIYEMRLKIVKCKAEGNCPPCTFCPRDQIKRYEQYQDLFVLEEVQELLREWNETYPGCNDCFLCSTFCYPFDGLPRYIENIDNETSKAHLDYLLNLTQTLQPTYESKRSKLMECDCGYEAQDFDFESAKKKIKLALPCEFCPEAQKNEYFKYEDMSPFQIKANPQLLDELESLWEKEYPECDACYNLSKLADQKEEDFHYLVALSLRRD